MSIHKGKRSKDIEDSSGIDRTTIWQTKNRYYELGVEKALEEDERPGQPIKYTTDHEA